MSEHDPDLETVDRWMLQFAEQPLPGAEPAGATLIWWKAQLLERLERERRVTAILDAAWRLAIVASSVVCLGMLGWVWAGIGQAGAAVFSPPILLAGMATLAAAIVRALAPFGSRRADPLS